MSILYEKGYLLQKEEEKNMDKIRKELTVQPIENSEYSKNETFPVFLENDKTMLLPKYWALQELGEPQSIEYAEPYMVKMEFKGTLKPLQNTIAEKILKKIKKDDNIDGGVISLPCGYGKTVLSLYLACKLGLKTLVIVHKKFLMNQWVERIEQFTTARIGRIQQSTVDVYEKDIVMGMLQSVSMKDYDEDVFSDFGLVIVDEVHHISSRVFSRALPKIGSRHMLGLSATPEREDGLSKVFHWHIGPMLHVEKRKTSSNVLVRIYSYDSDHVDFREKKQYSFKRKQSMVNLPATLTNIANIESRNTFIMEKIVEMAANSSRQILILSGRIDQLQVLNKLVMEYDDTIATGFYIGKMRQKELSESEKKQVIFASYEMAAEALDIPSLNTLILATSRKSIEQSVGRILRKETEIQPIVIDIVDKLKIFTGQGYVRRRFYKDCKYRMELYNVLHTSEEKNIKFVKQLNPMDSNSVDTNSMDANHKTVFKFVD